ncbi:MAG: lipopolysaccharide kinase InaA family protein [Victivallales bacterium]|nr:lipopolysaccharide kinase InaA family protein [Victivallales bacterium]
MIIRSQSRDHGRLLVNEDFAALLTDNRITTADALWEIAGTGVKNVVRERGTSRCFLQNQDGSRLECYIKRYLPIPWREKLKNMLTLKPYNFDAIHEWNALHRFLELGMNTMTPMAAARFADGRSCNLTLGITDYVRASELFAGFDPEKDSERRLRLIGRIARLAGRMHAAGIAHQDFYLVHFFVKPDEDDNVYLIDLQRMIFQPKLARRWRIKDLAQLHFSAARYVSETDIRFFWEIYAEQSGINPADRSLQQAATAKAERIRRHDAKRAARR